MGNNELCYQTVLDGIQDMIFVMRVSESKDLFYYEFINKKAIDVLNLSKVIIGKEITEINSAEITAILHEKYRIVIEQKQPITYEGNFYIEEVGNMVLETTLTPQFEGEKIVRIVTLTRDITAFKETDRERQVSNQRLKLSRRRYKSLFAENTDAIVYLDLAGEILRVNKAFENLINQDKKDCHGQNFFAILQPNRLVKVVQAFNQTVHGEAAIVDTEYVMADGSEAVLQVKFIPMIVEEEIRGVYAIIKDMTTERFSKQALMASEERFRLIAENSSDLIHLLGENGQFVYLSPSHQKVLGYDLDKLENMELNEIVAKADQPVIVRALATAYQEGNAVTAEIRFIDQLNKALWFELRIQPVFTKSDHFKHMVVVARDIQERKRYEVKLRKLAYHDSLTGLPNRRLFNDRLDQVLANYQRKDLRFAVMMLDIDDFKKINDQMGHDVGDKVMIEFGRCLKDAVREMDTVARMGGDEFMILLPEIDEESNVSKIIERIETAIKKPWQINGQIFSVKSSIGAVIPACKAFTAHQIIVKADEVLYQAKNTGKDKAIINVCNFVE